MERRRGILLAVMMTLAGLLTSCGNPEVGRDARYLVLDYNPTSQRYEVIEDNIETLDDVETVSGCVAYLRGGGDIVVGPSNPTTAREFRKALTVKDSQTPRVRYDVDRGVVKPMDFDSLMMLTLYHHLEKAERFFEGLGVERGTVGRLPVFYYPRLSVLIPLNLLTDNAAYAFTLDAFLIPPRLALKDVPLSANRGVITHEYSHAVFNRLVHDNQRAPDYLLKPWSKGSINRMRALDEGVADIFGALATGDANFIGPSISETAYDIDRDLSKERHYSAGMRADLDTADQVDLDPYQVGSVVASTVWALRSDVDDQTLGEAMVQTLRDFAAVEDGFTLVDFFDLLWAHLPSSAQRAACNTFQARLDVISLELACAY